jgi:phage terminase large subunit-like protein
VFSKFFLPAEKLDEAIERDQIPYRAYIQRGLLKLSGEHYVDYNDCFLWFKELVEKYDILPLQVGYDRYNSQYLVQDMTAYGFHMDDVYQGTNLTPVLREMEGDIKEGRVHIGDNDLLKIHFLNSAIKLDTDNNKIRLVKLSPTAHIDGMAALSDAFCVRQKWHESIGHQLSNKR